MDYIKEMKDPKDCCQIKSGVERKVVKDENEVNSCWKLARERGQVEANKPNKEDDSDRTVVGKEDDNTKKGLANMEDLSCACDLWLEK
ncbi:20029_t:CDS:1, partial [Gigaspora rosea]